MAGHSRPAGRRPLDAYAGHPPFYCRKAKKDVDARARRGHDKDIMKARVTVTLKTGVLDPQGKAIEGALKSLGVNGVASVRQGKVFDIEIDDADKAQAEAKLKEAAEKLLANTVIENYRVELLP
jgi:phosphoribosylformylglycinamidine synthase subunit PurS